MKCIIIGAGTFNEKYIPILENDLIICADGGYKYAKALNIHPHYLVGDFDSLDEKDIDKDIIQLKASPIKDETDIYLAIQVGIEKGYKEFYIYGCLGGRLEHTFANIQILFNLKEKGIKAILFNENEIVEIYHNETVVFNDKNQGYISLFSYTPTSRISIKNLKYNLENKELTYMFPLGIDNEFINEESNIIIHDGYVLSIINKK